MAEQTYDLLVIGGGAAGSSAVTNLQNRGLKIALAERDKLGGTCLNYGCDPTKTLLYIASQLHKARQADRYGLQILQAGFDWDAVQRRVTRVLEKIRVGSPEEAEKNFKEADLYKGQARFVSPHEVEIGGQRLRAEKIIIASGTTATVPPIEGLQEAGYITNIQAVLLKTLPKRLAIMGGGPIGIEFSQMFRRFGVEVTVLEKTPQILATEDRDLAGALVKLLAKEGVGFKTGVEVVAVSRSESGKRLTLQREDGEQSELVVDEILVAIGRTPALKEMNLEAAGVETSEKGIPVNKYLRTNVPHIWAAGDIASKYQFTHIASEQGKLAGLNAFSNEPQAYDESVMPWGVYTYPNIAHVGKTEEELKKDGDAYRVVLHSFDDLVRAITDDQTEGMVKLLVSPNGKLLGGHVLSEQAGELIAPLVLAMKAGLAIEVLAHTILPYPTLAEAVEQAADRLLQEK